MTRLENDECSGELATITVEKVIVPDGESWALTGTTVQGNVFVNTGSMLTASAVTRPASRGRRRGPGEWHWYRA